MGYKIHSFNISNKKSKKIKLISNTGKLLKTYDVPNFDNCYIDSQDAALISDNYIINGNLYNGTNNLIDDSGKCTCCDKKLNTNFSVFIKDNKLYKYSSDGTISAINENLKWIKVSGRDSGGTVNMQLALTDTTLYYLLRNGTINSLTTSTAYKNVVDICGVYNSASYKTSGYTLDSSGRMMQVNGDQITTNVRYISCCSNGSGSDTYGYSLITKDNKWQMISGYDPVTILEKVKEITPGNTSGSNIRQHYAITLDGALYHCATKHESQYDTKLSKIDDGNWVSLAAFVGLSGAYGVKGGKVYKLTGTTITEMPQFGTNNIKIEGVGKFLLYSI